MKKILRNYLFFLLLLLLTACSTPKIERAVSSNGLSTIQLNQPRSTFSNTSPSSSSAQSSSEKGHDTFTFQAHEKEYVQQMILETLKNSYFDEEKKKFEAALEAKINSIDNAYLKNQVKLGEDFNRKLDDYSKKSDNTLKFVDLLFKGIAFIMAIFGFVGFKSFADNMSSANDFRKYVNEILKTYDLIKEDIRERQRELHDHEGFTTRKKDHKLTGMEEAKFMDYEHRIFFMLTNLPITQDLSIYKESLYKLGSYWWWQNKPARAILRFEEIEKIHAKWEKASKGLLTRIRMDIALISSKILQKENVLDALKYRGQIMGVVTPYFYNFYANVCLDYATQCEEREEASKYIGRAENYFYLSINASPSYSYPYYNLGCLYAIDKNKSKENTERGIEFYNKALGKSPNIDFQIRRNLACAFIRINRGVDEIVKVLDPLPEKDKYWVEIFTDSVLSPLNASQEWKNFIGKKYPYPLPTTLPSS